MTLQEHVDYCLDLIEQGYGNLPLIYSEDSEGNNYQKVSYEPQLCVAENPESYYIELLEVKEGDFEPNCICIN